MSKRRKQLSEREKQLLEEAESRVTVKVNHKIPSQQVLVITPNFIDDRIHTVSVLTSDGIKVLCSHRKTNEPDEENKLLLGRIRKYIGSGSITITKVEYLGPAGLTGMVENNDKV